MRLITVILLATLGMGSLAAQEGGKSKAPAKGKGKAKVEEAAEASKELRDLEKGLTDAQRARLMEVINKGDAAALEALPGVGEAKAKLIVKARPFKSPLDLLAIEGIGEATVLDLIRGAKGRRKG
jgi:DNA uptake protein ComE-like DNA-binding protein